MKVKIDFMEVYENFQPKILYYIYRMTGLDEAEDITQEVFDKVSRALESFKGESKLSTWIYRIATNTALDRLRSTTFKHASDQNALEDGVEDRNVWTGHTRSSIDQKLVRKEMSECVWEYIEKLPSDYRTVIVLSEPDCLLQRFEFASGIDGHLNSPSRTRGATTEPEATSFSFRPAPRVG